MKKKLIIGISGATGVIYGIRLLEVLKSLNFETHLMITDAASFNIKIETGLKRKDVEDLATYIYSIDDTGAPIASGSFITDGMVVIPCSIKTLSAIAHSYNENLLIRAADVTLKEKRKLILVVRETPLHIGHLRIMTLAAEQGAIILPPMPSFYYKPKTISDIIDHTIGKILDQFHIENRLLKRWEGYKD
ncbi:MAG: 3-octaprenyl-4-hydroxybenzoate carboxy-lyase [Spirochaetes bacterium]|nr:UbiX family flavin prenyltransferase [Deltaproteobacteria bacterium]RKY03870.1 MAG: 3-octaprenyl-4-hydroxybenzoate carboxy-lyase [Spirochaetota bacterium]